MHKRSWRETEQRREEMTMERSRRSSRGMVSIFRIRLLGMLTTTMMMLLYTCMLHQSSVTFAKAEEVEEVATSSKNLAVIEMKVRNLYPESFDWDAKHNRFLVGSTTQGKLVTVTEEGIVEEFVTDEEYAGAAAILGVTVDSIHNRVLAVVQSVGVGVRGISALAAYNLHSKKRTLFVNLREEEGEDGKDAVKTNKTIANDVAVDYEGNAYVTNSGGNSIWKVTPEGVRSVFVEIPQLSMVVEVEFVKAITCNGIVHHDGYLLVAQTNSGALLRVRIADKAVQAVTISPAGSFLPEADGMVLRSDGSLVVVSARTAWLLSSRDNWRSAYLLDKVPLDAASFTTGGAVKDMQVFTIHAHLFDKMKGVDRDAFKIVEIEFPSDHHNNPMWLLLILGIFAVIVLAWRFQMNQFNRAYTKKRV